MRVPRRIRLGQKSFRPNSRTVYDHQKSQRLEFGEIDSIIYSSVNKYVTLSQDQYIKEKRWELYRIGDNREMLRSDSRN